MNKLLLRQVSKTLSAHTLENPEIQSLLELINNTYEGYEDQLSVILRGTELSNVEYNHINQSLKEEIEAQNKILLKLNEVVSVLSLITLDVESQDYHNLTGLQLADLIRKQAKTISFSEQQQRNLIDTIQKRNSELEDYAHVISHDLKSPLRNIDFLINVILEDSKALLDSKTIQNLENILKNIEKMDNLISGLLQFSKISKEDNLLEKIDLSEVINSVIEQLYIPKHIQINLLRKFPIIEANRFKIVQLFHNLITNAVNAIGDKSAGEVNIDIYENDYSKLVYTINDNGKGIEAKYLNKIFEIFQTLTANKNSTGIGLYIVQKIIDLYGGTIKVDSVVNVGTTFTFTLPLCQTIKK